MNVQTGNPSNLKRFNPAITKPQRSLSWESEIGVEHAEPGMEHGELGGGHLICRRTNKSRRRRRSGWEKEREVCFSKFWGKKGFCRKKGGEKELGLDRPIRSWKSYWARIKYLNGPFSQRRSATQHCYCRDRAAFQDHCLVPGPGYRRINLIWWEV